MTRRNLFVADSVRTPNGVAGNALLVEDGRVAAVGSHLDLGRSDLPEHRYPGGIIVPGLRDAHFHPVAYTSAISGISLKAAEDLDEVAALIRRGAEARAGPVVAVRLDDEGLREGRLPTRHDLDAAVSDRPVLIHRYCGHIAVANTSALTRAGVDAQTPDPPGGVIDRDRSGVPTGVLRETAIDAVSATLAAAITVSGSQLIDAMTGLAGLGITSLGAMTRTGDGPWATLGNEARLLIDHAADLPIRLHSYLIAASADELEAASRDMADAGAMLRWAGLKRFGDGSLGGHTAAMHEPFSDEPEELGTLRLGEVDRELSEAAIELGGDVAIHAIGDRACAAVIDLFEDLVASGVAGRRLRLEHASVLTERDVARISRLGVIASVQPAFLASETGWLHKRVGPERLRLTYPLATLESAGVLLAGGSDCPVEPPNPWWGMAAARDRAGIVLEEALSAESAFRLFTSGAAAALHEPEPLAVGSPADFLVVDRDPVASTPDEVRDTWVEATRIAGEAVEFDRSIATWAG